MTTNCVIKPGPKQFMDNDNGRNYHVEEFNSCNRKSSSRNSHFKFEGRVIDSTGGLNLKEVPEIVVIGGATLVQN